MNGHNRNPNVTMIEELPYLEDLENNHPSAVLMDKQIHERPDINTERIQKYIRPSFTMNNSSGMELNNAPLMPPKEEIMNNTHFQPQQQFQMQDSAPYKDYRSLNCIDVADHVQNCPVCSKFYNNDKTIYIIVIIVLSIICLLLLKKVLDV